MKNRQLVALCKSGCCYHETKKYQALNNRPVLVEKGMDDATGDMRVVTTKKLIKGASLSFVTDKEVDTPHS